MQGRRKVLFLEVPQCLISEILYKMANTFIILLYHGVSDQPHKGIENCSHKHISVDDFAAQLQTLKAHYRVFSLPDLLQQKHHGALPENAVALTFDDGFANNYSLAFPLLQQFDLPATFYLASGFINTRRSFWVDKLEYLINESPLSSLEIDSLQKQFSLQSLEDRKTTLQAIKSALKSASALIEKTVAELEQICQVSPDYDYADYRLLSWDQVREMAQSGLCEFGGHTVDHVILSHLPAAEKQVQIAQCKATLETELNRPIRLFSYPEGQSCHYDESCIEVLKKQGFTSSPSAIFGVNNDKQSDFHLYRNMVGFTAPFLQCLGAPSLGANSLGANSLEG